MCFNFSLKITNDIIIENINSICPTALTSAAVAIPNATNQQKVAPVPQIPAGKLGFQYLKTAKNCSFLKNIIKNLSVHIIAIKDTMLK